MSLGSFEICENDIQMIERFVVLLYDRAGSSSSVNFARRWLFTKKGRTIDNCPPTSDALRQHIQRAVLQCSIWRETWITNHVELDPTKFGWVVNNDDFSPLWMTNQKLQNLVKNLSNVVVRRPVLGVANVKKLASFALNYVFVVEDALI